MKHTLFDKIFLGFLFLSVSVFALILFYSTIASKNALVNEKIEVLSNEADLIAKQTLTGYADGTYSIEQIQNNFEYYTSMLDASIWFVDDKGIIIAFSNAETHPDNPKNIFFLDNEFDLTTGQSFTGDFFGYFNDDVISVSLPVNLPANDNESQIQIGTLLLHSTVSQIKDVQMNIIQVIYVPFLVMIIISFTLLGLISRKIMRPLKKINAAAEEYSTGNFDVEMDIHTDDEIGQLANTLEYMASELSKLEEYRKEFISNISHDFRSPLTSIKGYIEAIQDGTIPPEKQDKYLGIVVNETKRLTKLTSSLLELNNYDSYGLWLVVKDFDILTLVKNAMSTFEGKCEARDILLTLENNCINTVVRADKTKIQQVIYNLLDNAIKFTPDGKQIHVILDEKKEKIYVSVKDEGCGIPKDSVNKVWDRFYKADSSRGKDKQGTGLGLAITKEIIKAHGENINVVSTEDVGSEFTFSLSKSGTEKLVGSDDETQELIIHN